MNKNRIGGCLGRGYTLDRTRRKMFLRFLFLNRFSFLYSVSKHIPANVCALRNGRYNPSEIQRRSYANAKLLRAGGTFHIFVANSLNSWHTYAERHLCCACGKPNFLKMTAICHVIVLHFFNLAKKLFVSAMSNNFKFRSLGVL